MHEAYLLDKENIRKETKQRQDSRRSIKSITRFEDFRNRYFKTETGDQYETADFHENWIQYC